MIYKVGIIYSPKIIFWEKVGWIESKSMFLGEKWFLILTKFIHLEINIACLPYAGLDFSEASLFGL